MIIFQLVDKPYRLGENPYIVTLMESIKKTYPDFDWIYGFDNFWSDKILSCDILHIHWPDTMVYGRRVPSDFVQRFKCRLFQIKEKGIKIVVTCHNLQPHYSKDAREKACYELVYNIADSFIHLGFYSFNKLKEIYPYAKHIVIPHHTYDTLYGIPTRQESLKKLHLREDKRYILCFGAFRNKEERALVDQIVNHYRPLGIEVLAPNYYLIQNRRNFVIVFIQWLKCVIKRLTTSGVHIYGKFVPDDLVPYFYGASDISFIQRKKILNSGNLALGFLMGNVVVGPDVGNVGQLLKKYNNPTFDVDREESIFSAIDLGLVLSKEGLGDKNLHIAQKYFSTQVISQELYSFYVSVLN